MEIMVYTSSPEVVDPQEIARTLEQEGGWYVRSVSVNEDERSWNPEAHGDAAPWREGQAGEEA